METERKYRETGFDVLEIGVQMRKLMIISIRRCYRSVGNHPFLVCTLCFMILLYRSFPFVFSLLVSASPVLVCTAVLLGALLSFGQPNIPEIDKEENKTNEILALKAGVLEDAMVVRRDASFTIERYIGKGRDRVEKANEEESEVSKVDDNTVLVQCEKQMIEEEGEGEFVDLEFEHTMEIQEKVRNENGYVDREVVGNQYSLIPKRKDENFEVRNEKFRGELMESSSDLSWKKGEEEEGEDGDDNDDEPSSDSGSDGAESSSPDASMADIIPMLDELHPLLDSEAPKPACMSHDDDSDIASEGSQKCNNCSVESDEDTENHEEEEGEDDNDEEEEEMQGDQTDGNKSVITWTEDDQKNLIDLGTSELERNQRLENLIARRRARKNFRLTAEKNLIDLESTDLPFNVTPILTARRNPFDLPYDSNDDMGLPPVPGSAPSILLPRRNPFDLPYEPNEEKPDLMADSFQQEFMTFHRRDTFFRRHESFSFGALGFGGGGLKQDVKWRPYFIPERLASEGTSYPSFQRQSSEVSDSKVSCVPETESNCSAAADQEDKKLCEHDISHNTELISEINHASAHVEGSQSSEEIEQVEKIDVHREEGEIKMGNLENYQVLEMSLAGTGAVVCPVEFDKSEIHLNTETVEKHSNRSSLSSLSEVDDEIVDIKKELGSTSLGLKGDIIIVESAISMQSSPEHSNSNFTCGVVDDNQTKEPVYDSSPPSVEKLLSFSSISSDLQLESSVMGSPPVSVPKSAPFADEESEVHKESTEKVTPSIGTMQAGSSQVRAVDEIELYMSKITAISEHNVTKFGSSGLGRNSDDPKESQVLDSVIEHVSINSSSSFPDTRSVEDHVMHKEERFQHELDQVPSFSADTEIHVGVHQDMGENLDSASSNYQHMPSEDLNWSAVEEPQPSLVVEQVSVVHPNLSSSQTKSMEEHLVDQEKPLQVEPDQVQSRSDTKIHVDVHQAMDEKLVTMPSSYQIVPSEDKSFPFLEKQLSLSEKFMTDPSFYDHEEPLESSLVVAESIEEVSITNYVNIPEVHYPKDKVLADFSPSAPPDCTSISSEVPEGQSQAGIDLKRNMFDENENEDQIHSLEPFKFSAKAFESHVADRRVSEDADVIKEIDEELLLELDTVGDFGVVKETGSNLNEFGKYLGAHAENFFVSDSEEAIEKPIVESLHAELIPAKPEFGCSSSVLLCKDRNLIETNLELPVLDARSFEDIDLAFKQLHEGVDVEELILPSSIHDWQVVVEPEVPVKEDSDLRIVEARSLEDIHRSLVRVSESNLDQQPKPLESKEKSEVEANEVSYSMEIESSGTKSQVQETSTNAAENQIHEVDETSEDSNLIKKAKPHKLRSRSSSSSSSTDSD